MATEYKEKLMELFYYNGATTEQQIDEVIAMVLEQQPSQNSDENLEEMVNLLIVSGDSALVENAAGAVGVTPNQDRKEQEINKNLDRLISFFPDISPDYLREFCRQYETFNLDQIIEDLSDNDYMKIEKDPIDVWEHLKQMLPNADPIYLRNHARVLVNRPPEELQHFIENAIETNDYPTMQEYLINQDLLADFEFYITKFSAAAYLKRVPDPEIFTNPERKSILSENANESDLEFALTFLSNQFLFQRKRDIEKIFNHFNRDLMKTCNKLRSLPKAFRHPRKLCELTECKNIELMKEISYLKHEKIIKQFLKQKDEKYRLAFEEAKAQGLLQECACCFDNQLIPEECYFCIKGCIFCKDCVKSGAENVIGKEETVFPCLAECDSHFDYSTLQMVLDTKVFQGVCHRRQIEEIRNANIDGLETCPHCDFCMIPDEGDKIFKCRNKDCMAETCRLCRHKAHIPLRCNEIEYDEDVKMRTFIENKMTEALLRKCLKCGKQFYKDSGCNKMTCVCGAKMCYVCGQAISDYNHFGSGRCPLYTENLQQFHLNKVLEGARSAKDELGITVDPNKLKFDPTRNVERDVQ